MSLGQPPNKRQNNHPHQYACVALWRNSRAFAPVAGFDLSLSALRLTALGKLLTRLCLCHQAV